MNRMILRSATVLLAGVTACSDATGPDGPFPPPEGPPTRLLIKRTIGYFASEPEARQAGEFTYGAQDRLIAYRFGELVNGEIQATIRKDFVYRDDGLRWGNDTYIRQADGTWRLTRVIRFAYDVERGLPVEIHWEAVDEAGDVTVATYGIGYDEFGRVTEIRAGTEINTYNYDRNGDVVIARHDDIRFGVQVATLEYGAAWNPFADFLPYHGTHTGIFAPDYTSLHLSERYENAVDGEAPAAMATAVTVTNEYGYPVRREYTTWNTTDPDVRTTAVTEYEYVEDGQ